MPGPKSLIEQNAVEAPLYTYLDAARYLRVPVWVTISAAVRPLHHPAAFFERFLHEPELRVGFRDDYGPTLRGEGAERLSFRSLAALFVMSAAFRPFQPDIAFHRYHPEALERIFEVSRKARYRSGEDPRLFTDAEFVLDLYGPIYERQQEADRAFLLKMITLHQSRVESNDGVPVLLFPFSREPAPDAPRSVVIDPEVRFGRPTVKGAPTDVLVERWRAGDSASDIAEDYGLTTDEVEEALRYEAIPYHNFLFPFPPFGW